MDLIGSKIAMLVTGLSVIIVRDKKVDLLLDSGRINFLFAEIVTLHDLVRALHNGIGEGNIL